MADRRPNQGRKRPGGKQPRGKSPGRVSKPVRSAPTRGGRGAAARGRDGSPSGGGPSRGGPSRGGPSRGGPSRGAPNRGAQTHNNPVNESSFADTTPSNPGLRSPPSPYDYANTTHYSRPPSGTSTVVTAGQDFQQIDPRFSQEQQFYYQEQAANRQSARHEGRHSPAPDPSLRLDGRSSPRHSTRNSPRLGDRRSARLAYGEEDYFPTPRDIEMGSINPAFSDQYSPRSVEPDDYQRRASNASSVSYRSSNAEEDEITERELIAANLRDPSSVLEMLPSRQLGRTLSSATSSNKWLRKSTQRSLKRGRSTSTGRHPDKDVNVEMIIERILVSEDSIEGIGRKHSLSRRTIIRNLQGSIDTKRKVRDQVQKRSDRRKQKSVGIFKYWRYQMAYGWESFKEWLSNLTYSLELWRDPIKRIEGHFGSGVKSYFVLLKWLLLLNIPVFFLSFCFITLPQLLYQPSAGQENSESFTGAELLTGVGWLTETELYIGYYTNETFSVIGSAYYNMPLAYLFASSGYLLLIFGVLAQGMSSTYREYFITGDRRHNFYTSKVFCGWDYSITSENTAKLKQRSIYLELAEHLASHHGSQDRNLKFICLWFLRLLMNILVLGIIAGASYLIFYLYKEKLLSTDIIIIGDLAIALLVSGYNLFLPYIFSVIGYLERYENPRVTLYFSLFRTFLMKATILIVLIYHWFNQIECTEDSLPKPLSCQCWETFLGTEVYKLVIVDFLVQILATFFLEFIRRIGQDYFCKLFASPEFDIARNTMDLIQSQTYTWIGMFFAPLLMIICIIKLIILFYIKQISVLHNCKPSLRPWRAGIAQTLFIVILFLMYAICVGSVGYSFVSIQPSADCGPFRGLSSVFEVVTQLINQWEETRIVWNFIIKFLTTQGVVAALITLLFLAVHYFRTVSQGRQATVKRLKQQIALEGKDKLFLLRMLQNAIRNHSSIRQAGASATNMDPAEAAAAIPPPMGNTRQHHLKVRRGQHDALSPKVHDAVNSADYIIHGS